MRFQTKKTPELGERGCQKLRGHLRERFMKVTFTLMPQCGRPVKVFFSKDPLLDRAPHG
jgi:hypothetical protein